MKRTKEEQEEWMENVRIAESNNVSYDAFRCRVLRGESMEQARSMPVQNKGRNKYREYYKICKENGIPRATFRRRVMRGMSLYEACRNPVKGKYRRKDLQSSCRGMEKES